MEPVKNLLVHGSRSIFSMVIDPTVRRKNNGKRGEAHSSGNGAHPTKDRNTFWEYKSEGSQAPDRGKPSCPMDEVVGLEMLRITEDAHKDIFSREMQVDAAWDNKSNEGNAIGDLLHKPTGSSERGSGNPLAAILIDYIWVSEEVSRKVIWAEKNITDQWGSDIYRPYKTHAYI
jgi:hypothetical protein